MHILHSPVEVISRAARYLGANRAFRAIHQRHLLILNYHGVAPDEYLRNPELYGNVIGASEFSQQMAELVQFFHPISIAELREWQVGRFVPRNPVLVTFDDGYRNNLTCAAPILERYGVPAVIHICPGYVGQKRILWPDEIYLCVLYWPDKKIPLPGSLQSKHVPEEFSERVRMATQIRESCKRIPVAQLAQYLSQLRNNPIPKVEDELYSFLTWEDVRTLRSRGFDIGSHTMEHPILTQVPRETLAAELRDSKRIIEEQLGSECACFAYPNGSAADVSPEVVREVSHAGYEFAFTVMGRLALPHGDRLLLDRIFIPGAMPAFEFQYRVCGFHSALRRWLTV